MIFLDKTELEKLTDEELIALQLKTVEERMRLELSTYKLDDNDFSKTMPLLKIVVAIENQHLIELEFNKRIKK